VVSDGTKVYQQATLDTEFRVSSAGDAGWTDQIVEAKVKVLAFTGSSTSYLAGVFARFKDLDNHYYVALQSNGELKIKKKSAGNNTSISSSATATISPNTWYAIKLAVIGSTLTAYLDGVQVLTATDTEIAAGGVAVGTKNATAEFDDVRVTAP
jgi:pectate lyase